MNGIKKRWYNVLWLCFVAENTKLTFDQKMQAMAALESHDRMNEPAQKSRVRRACATKPCTGPRVN